LLHDRRRYLQSARLATRPLIAVAATVAVTRAARRSLPLRRRGRTLRTAEAVPTSTWACADVWIATRLEASRLYTGCSPGLAWFTKPSPPGSTRFLSCWFSSSHGVSATTHNRPHRSLLLCKGRTLGRSRRGHPAEEPLVINFASRNSRGRNGAIAESQIARRRSDGQCSSYLRNLQQLSAVHRNLIPESSPLEILRGDGSHAVRDPGIPKAVHKIRVADDIIDHPASSIPRVKSFKRSQRNPAHVPESETCAKTGAAESEEADHGGVIPVVAISLSGEPRPAKTVTEVPRTVVERGPSPRVVINPSPAVIVFPNPLAVLIRSPVGGTAGVHTLP